jgi:hypothetical protein
LNYVRSNKPQQLTGQPNVGKLALGAELANRPGFNTQQFGNDVLVDYRGKIPRRIDFWQIRFVHHQYGYVKSFSHWRIKTLSGNNLREKDAIQT